MPNEKCVKIMSLHASKGLSAKYVVILNVTADILPAKYHGASEYSLEHEDEQRRLFYVAVTRCAGSPLGVSHPGTLIISAKKGRRSKFIAELDKPIMNV